MLACIFPPLLRPSAPAAQDVAPFHYRHLGSFAFIGADNAVLEVPLNQKKPSGFTGFLTGLLWKGLESYEQISLKVCAGTCLTRTCAEPQQYVTHSDHEAEPGRQAWRKL